MKNGRGNLVSKRPTATSFFFSLSLTLPLRAERFARGLFRVAHQERDLPFRFLSDFRGLAFLPFLSFCFFCVMTKGA